MTLTIKPVKLKQSIYFRVPNDIADLIGIDPHAEVTLNLEEQDTRFLLIYSVRKSEIQRESRPSREPQILDVNDAELAPIQRVQRSMNIERQE